MGSDALNNLGIIKRELIIFLICFFVICVLAIAGIIYHKSPAIELITELPGVLAVAVISYMAVVVLRVLYRVISRFWFRK
jgi:hypothetical protein